MRHVVGDRIGRTDFFRNAPFLSALVELLRAVRSPRILVHAAATGAEPYSLVMAARLAGLDDIAVYATDIEPSFLEIAKRGVYEEGSLGKVPREAMKFFLPGSEPGTVEVAPDVRASVTFLSPASFVAFQANEAYDAVLALNAMTYVSRQEQRRAIVALAAYARSYLCITAASPAIVKEALDAAGFEPVERPDWLKIYYGWWDRVRFRPGRREWALPLLPYVMKDWRYSASTIFRRRPDHAATGVRMA